VSCESLLALVNTGHANDRYAGKDCLGDMDHQEGGLGE